MANHNCRAPAGCYTFVHCLMRYDQSFRHPLARVSHGAFRFSSARIQWFSRTLGDRRARSSRGWEAIREGRLTLTRRRPAQEKRWPPSSRHRQPLTGGPLGAAAARDPRCLRLTAEGAERDIHRNSPNTRRGIRQLAESQGVDAPRITAAVSTADTTQAERAASCEDRHNTWSRRRNRCTCV